MWSGSEVLRRRFLGEETVKRYAVIRQEPVLSCRREQ
jgi:hypothetical protein